MNILENRRKIEGKNIKNNSSKKLKVKWCYKKSLVETLYVLKRKTKLPNLSEQFDLTNERVVVWVKEMKAKRRSGFFFQGTKRAGPHAPLRPGGPGKRGCHPGRPWGRA